jgi:hypothetical protein
MNKLHILLCFFLALLSGNLIAQRIIKGVVVDSESGVPLSKASVKFASNGTFSITDDAGNFQLQISDNTPSDTFVVTYVGYHRYAQFISGASESDLKIELARQVKLLNEVSVISEFWRKQYSPKQMVEDYQKFTTIMENVHTGLFDYLTEAEWIHLKDSSMNLFKSPLTHSEFYQLIALHVGRVRNKHTLHGVTDWWYKQKQNIFPFNVRYFDERLYVSESLVKESAFPKGTEILSINGRTPAQIKAMVWPYIPADGYNITGKTAALNDYFPWYFSLFVEEAKTYMLRLKKPDGEIVSLETRGLRDSFAHLSFQQVWRWKKSALELNVNESTKTAYLRIEDSRVFKDSLAPYFQRIMDSGVRNLIMDLRGGGGIRTEENVAELFSFLIKKPSLVYEKLEIKSNDVTLFDKDFSFKPYGKSLKHIKQAYFDRLVLAKDGSYRWQEESYMILIEPVKLTFSGKVYILTDGRNYSASTDFTSIAAQLPNVFVVGEETGGEYRSYISGAMFGLVLPNTKIGIKVPTWKSVLAIPENPSQHGRGVLPDFPITQSFEDFVSGRDTVKEYAYDLISGKSH